MYILTIYFRGPRTEWAGKVCAEETIVSKQVPMLCLARIKARQLLREMVLENVGYVITDSTGLLIEPTQDPPVPAYRNAESTRSTIHGWPKHLED